jgi:hypothetical protein
MSEMAVQPLKLRKVKFFIVHNTETIEMSVNSLQLLICNSFRLCNVDRWNIPLSVMLKHQESDNFSREWRWEIKDSERSVIW